MSAISYSLVTGGTLEQVVAATSAPGAGQVEIRIDTTATTVTDGSLPAGVRAQKKQEVYLSLITLLEYLIRDTNVPE
jgi:predicted xylose isomerase-like sugar epimerase